MKKYLFAFSLLLSGSALAQMPCTGFNGDTHDFWVDYWKTSNCTVTESGSPYIPPGRGTNPLDGSGYAYLSDDVSGSIYYNDVRYNKLGTFNLGDCLCFDYVLYDDGRPGHTDTVHPRIYVGWGTKAIYFESSLTVDEIRQNWVRVCAPIKLADSNGQLPSNTEGTWHVSSGTTLSDFDDVLKNADKVYFVVDVSGSPTQDEKIGVDNVCIKVCNCDSKSTAHELVLTYNTISPSPFIASPSNVTVSVNHFDPTYTYEYSWGDGTTSVGGLSVASHMYPIPGTYTFKLSRINTWGQASCVSTSTVFCTPVSTDFSTVTGGMNPPEDPICKSGFTLTYTYNTEGPSPFLALPHLASVAVNNPHPGSQYTYHWGGGVPPLLTSAWTASHLYTYATPGPLQICLEEKNGNDDGFCEAKTCIEMCWATSYDVAELFRIATESEEVAHNDNALVLPNPSSGKTSVRLNLAKERNVSITVTDMLGRDVLRRQEQHFDSGVQQIDLDLSDLGIGIYQVQIKLDALLVVKRLSILK